MKLLACHIENFGRLSDFSMDFSEGMNVINEQNGWGKSTLAAFLKVMFYGFDAKKEPKAMDKERSIYRPWQGGSFGGELDFEVNGKQYRISRSFGKTEKTDEFHLYDLSTNLESQDYSKNIGMELFDLDSASFKRSVFIGQNDCECISTDSINAKLGNLAENTNDINNFENACGKLKDMLNRLSPTRATGSIKKRKHLMEQLSLELRSFEAAEEGLEHIQALQNEKLQEKEQLVSDRQKYAAALQQVSWESMQQEKRVQYEALCAEEKQLGENCKQYQNKFPAGVPKEEDLRRFTGTVRQLAETAASIRNLKGDEETDRDYEQLSVQFAEGIPDKSTIQDYLEKQKEISGLREEVQDLTQQMNSMEASEGRKDFPEEGTGKVKPSGGNICGILVIVIGVLGLIASIGVRFLFSQIPMTRYAPAVGFILAGICFIIASALFRLGRGQKEKKQQVLRAIQEEQLKQRQERDKPLLELQEQISQKQQKIVELAEQIGTFLASHRKEAEQDQYVSALYELSSEAERYERLCQTRAALQSAEDKQCELQSQVEAFEKTYYLNFGEDIAADLSDIQTKATEYRLAKQSYEKALWKKQQFEAQNDVQKLLSEKKSGYTLEGLNAAIREVDDSLEEVRNSIEQYSRQMEDLQQQMEMREEREAELKRNQSLQEEELHKYEIMECAQEYLQKAKEQFTSRYMAPISNGFRKYYHILTQSTRDNWQIDANIRFMIREEGEMRQPGYLSSGYQDLIGICMRFALAEAMYPEEKPFLILDDPFVNLDDDKVEAGKQLIAQVSKEYQTIYFTCHASRRP